MAPDVEGHRLVQTDGDSGVVTWHRHLDPFRQLYFAGDVRGPEKEPRLVPAEERRVQTTFVLAQNVDLTLELQPRTDRARSSDHLAPLDLVGLDASQQQADVLSSFALSESTIQSVPIHRLELRGVLAVLPLLVDADNQLVAGQIVYGARLFLAFLFTIPRGW